MEVCSQCPKVLLFCNFSVNTIFLSRALLKYIKVVSGTVLLHSKKPRHTQKLNVKDPHLTLNHNMCDSICFSTDCNVKKQIQLAKTLGPEYPVEFYNLYPMQLVPTAPKGIRKDDIFPRTLCSQKSYHILFLKSCFLNA